MTDSIKVGYTKKKLVTKRNHEIYERLLKIMLDERYKSHMGKTGLSKIADEFEKIIDENEKLKNIIKDKK